MNNQIKARSILSAAAFILWALPPSLGAHQLNKSHHDVDSYHRYLSDVLLIESRQMLRPYRPFHYDSSKNGKLLKSVLSEERFATALIVYRNKIGEGKTEENISTLLRPLMRQYSRAFAIFGERYENEFLDTMQIGAMLLIPSPPSTDESSNIHPDIENENFGFRELSLDTRRMLYRQLQELITRKKFTIDGEDRARKIMHRLIPGEDEPEAYDYHQRSQIPAPSFLEPNTL